MSQIGVAYGENPFGGRATQKPVLLRMDGNNKQCHSKFKHERRKIRECQRKSNIKFIN